MNQHTAIQTGYAKAPDIFLGISAKSSDTTTGQGFSAGNHAKLAAKVERFLLLRMSQSLVYDRNLSADAQKRVCWCHRTIVSPAADVGVFRVQDGSNARFSGVSTCGSVWHCPVCASKITEARREELQEAMVSHITGGGAAYLLTLTFPHEADHPLPELMERFAKALKTFKESGPYKRILGKDGSARRLGSVRSLEVTVSLENGWHPHTHDLLFCERNGLEEIMFDDAVRIDDAGDLDSTPIKELKASWVKQLLRAGLGEQSKVTWMMEHALNVRGGEYAAQYIAKFGRDERWGASSELTRPHSKIGVAFEEGGITHFTPFQLLSWAMNDDGWAANRFRDYAEAFQGKRMLSWSPGLKRTLLGIENEESDEQLAAAPMPEEAWIGQLSDDQFQVLLTRNKTGEFLRYVAECCTDSSSAQVDIDDYIAALKATPATHGSAYRKQRLFRGDEGIGRYIVAEGQRT